MKGIPFRWFPVALLGFIFTAPQVSASHSDVVEFGGSRMVGELKQLERGKLSFKTDSTGTIEIDWADVTLTCPDSFGPAEV